MLRRRLSSVCVWAVVWHNATCIRQQFEEKLRWCGKVRVRTFLWSKWLGRFPPRMEHRPPQYVNHSSPPHRLLQSTTGATNCGFYVKWYQLLSLRQWILYACRKTFYLVPRPCHPPLLNKQWFSNNDSRWAELETVIWNIGWKIRSLDGCIYWCYNYFWY